MDSFKEVPLRGNRLFQHSCEQKAPKIKNEIVQPSLDLVPLCVLAGMESIYGKVYKFETGHIMYILQPFTLKYK